MSMPEVYQKLTASETVNMRLDCETFVASEDYVILLGSEALINTRL